MFKKLMKLIQLLNSNSKASQIANSFCIGLMLGVMPKNNLFWYVLFVFFLFVRINKNCYGIMILLGALIAPLCDSLFDTVGYAVLTFSPLENFYAGLLDVPFVGFTKFNNSIVTGSLVCSLIVYLPLFVIVVLFVRAWRKTIAPKLIKSKFMKGLYKVPMVKKLIALKSE